MILFEAVWKNHRAVGRPYFALILVGLILSGCTGMGPVYEGSTQLETAGEVDVQEPNPVNPFVELIGNPEPFTTERVVVAVSPFANAGDSASDNLGFFISEYVTTALTGLPAVTVVERKRLFEIINEQKIQLSGLTESGGAQVGALLNADHILSGSFFADDERLFMSCRLVHVETGAILASATSEDSDLRIATERLLSDLLQSALEAGYTEYSVTLSLAAAVEGLRDQSAQSLKTRGRTLEQVFQNEQASLDDLESALTANRHDYVAFSIASQTLQRRGQSSLQGEALYAELLQNQVDSNRQLMDATKRFAKARNTIKVLLTGLEDILSAEAFEVGSDEKPQTELGAVSAFIELPSSIKIGLSRNQRRQFETMIAAQNVIELQREAPSPYRTKVLELITAHTEEQVRKVAMELERAGRNETDRDEAERIQNIARSIDPEMYGIETSNRNVTDRRLRAYLNPDALNILRDRAVSTDIGATEALIDRSDALGALRFALSAEAVLAFVFTDSNGRELYRLATPEPVEFLRFTPEGCWYEWTVPSGALQEVQQQAGWQYEIGPNGPRVEIQGRELRDLDNFRMEIDPSTFSVSVSYPLGDDDLWRSLAAHLYRTRYVRIAREDDGLPGLKEVVITDRLESVPGTSIVDVPILKEEEGILQHLAPAAVLYWAGTERPELEAVWSGAVFGTTKVPTETLGPQAAVTVRPDSDRLLRNPEEESVQLEIVDERGGTHEMSVPVRKSTLWQASIKGSAASVGKHAVFVADEKFVRALSLANGRQLWRKRISAQELLYTHERLIVWGRDEILALSPDDGSEEWNLNIEADSFTVSSGRLIAADLEVRSSHNAVIGDRRRTVCLDITSGDILWEIDDGQAVAAHADRVFISTLNRKFFSDSTASGQTICVDLETGAELWRTNHFGYDVLFYDNRLYLTHNYKLQITTCLSPTTGGELWVASIGGDHLVSSGDWIGVATEGSLYGGIDYVHFLDAESGWIGQATPSIRTKASSWGDVLTLDRRLHLSAVQPTVTEQPTERKADEQDHRIRNPEEYPAQVRWKLLPRALWVGGNRQILVLTGTDGTIALDRGLFHAYTQ